MPARRRRQLLAVGVLWLTSLGTGAAAGLVIEALEDPGARTAQAASRPATRPQAAVRIGWAGDMVLGSRHGLPPEDGRPLLRAMRPALRRPDLMIANYEGTIGTAGAPKCPMEAADRHCFAFQAPDPAARTLRWAGIDVVNLANNHANDYGPAGLAATHAALEAATVAHTGAPGQVLLMRKRGVRIAIVGFAPYAWSNSLLDPVGAAALVRQASSRAHVVIVLIHAGGEGAGQTHTPIGREVAYGQDRGDTRGFAHTVVDAGADLVLGSGPHVVRGIERYKDRLIAYSLGNFTGYKTFPTHGVSGLSGLLEVELEADGKPRSGHWRSVRLRGPGVPAHDPGHGAARLVDRLGREDFGTTGVRVGRTGALRLRR